MHCKMNRQKKKSIFFTARKLSRQFETIKPFIRVSFKNSKSMFLIFKIILVIRKISSVRAGLGLHTFGGTYSNCEGGVEVFSSSHRVILNGMFSFQTIFNFLCTLFYSHYATHCSPRLLRVYCWVQRCHKCDEFKQKHKSQREERKKG